MAPMGRLRGPAPAAAPALACAAGTMAAFCLPISNPDLFWHLSAAREMVARGALLRSDWLSHTMDGVPWADFEWLVQLLWYAAYEAAGFRGLWLVKFLVYGAAAGALWKALRLYRIGATSAGLGVFAWALAVSPANDLRPENFSLLLFLLLWTALEARRLGVLRAPPLRYQAAAAAALFAAWANLHAGFIYGLVLLGIFAAIDGAARRRWELILLFLIAGFAALLNPYGRLVYSVPLEHWAALPDLERYIREWQGASILSEWLWPFWGVLVSSFAAVLCRYLARRDVPLEHVAALCVFGLSASSHIRTSVYFLSAAIPITAAALAGFSSIERRVGLKRFLAAGSLATAWAFFCWRIVPALSQPAAFLPLYVPVELARFLERERPALAGLRLFNPWHWGGYLGWRLHPDYKVFVDGRYIFHPLLRPMYEAARDPAAYAKFMDRHAIETAVLQRTKQVFSEAIELKDGGKAVLWRPFYIAFLPRRDWALVYWDHEGCVFVRRSAAPAAWLKGREYTLFRPDDLEAAFLMVREGHAPYAALESEVRRYLDEHPGEAALRAAAIEWLAELAPESAR